MRNEVIWSSENDESWTTTFEVTTPTNNNEAEIVRNLLYDGNEKCIEDTVAKIELNQIDKRLQIMFVEIGNIRIYEALDNSFNIIKLIRTKKVENEDKTYEEDEYIRYNYDVFLLSHPKKTIEIEALYYNLTYTK